MAGERPSIGIWRWTMAFTGVGSAMLGPFLPRLLVLWPIQDRQAGMLVASLFLGSFSGTMFMPRQLERSLRRGALTACVGCLGFAAAVHFRHGFAAALASLLLMGFGMGQLMSSINLLVGATPPGQRVRQLALLGAAWCAGAVLSPSVSTVLLRGISPSLRLGVLSFLYLLPLCGPGGLALPPQEITIERSGEKRGLLANGALLCTLMFLIYGGIEASISAWTPLFATRYADGPVAASQWILSLFWSGLIVGRMILGAFSRPGTESLVYGTAGASMLLLLWLTLSASFIRITIGTVLLGICVSPLFPLLLATTLEYKYSNRVMGLILGSCALGSALFPLLMGVLSSSFSLRAAMILPIGGLLTLVAVRWGLRPMMQIAL